MSSLLLQSLQGPRSSGLLSLNEYRESEIRNQQLSVSRGGAVLEYETLTLRVHPPNVEIDNTSFPDCTVVTVDSANRAGTLVEIAQCLAELGLNVQTARISSDGGWFVDEFHVTECNKTKVVNEKKLTALRKVLGLHYEGAMGDLDATRLCRTIFELAGHDRPGVLHDVVSLLKHNGCGVESVAVWTYGTRCAFVVCVVENEQHINDGLKVKRLTELLLQIMDPNGTGIARADQKSTGPVYYERRLHQLMLTEAERDWQQNNGQRTPCSPDLNQATDVRPYISPKYSRPEVNISWDSQRGYWVVDVKCKDRNKLFFDTVCTLADLEYDIYHGSVDIESEQCNQLYYVRPRFGASTWDGDKASKLQYLLEASLQRRFPKGVKVHIKAKDNCCLSTVTEAWKSSGICITRAKVRTYGGSIDHTFYLMDGNGGPPDEAKLQESCQQSGGRLLTSTDEASPPIPGEGAQFFFALCQRNWDGSPNSCVSSSA